MEIRGTFLAVYSCRCKKMATLTVLSCDECGKETRRVVEIEDHLYCSRDCYLTACKRYFDQRWFEMLRTGESDLKPKVVTPKVVAPKVA